MTDTLERPAPTSGRGSAPAGVPALPRPLVVVAAVVLAVGVVTSLVGAWRTGVSWDETYHVMRLRSFLEHGWYLLDGDLDHGSPGAWEDQRYVYGPAAALLLHAWSVLWGTESWGTVSATDHAFAVRHLGVALIALVGVGATAGTARLLLRGWTWALLAAAALVAVPTWTGHSMFNVKDVPVATGYTLVTFGVALLVARTSARSSAPAPRWVAPAAFLALVAGALLAVGTRPGIWPGLALAFGIGALTRDRTRLVTLVLAGLVGLGLLVVVYPEAFGNPIGALMDSVLESSHFDGKKGPWWYLPLFLLVELPTVLFLAGAAGTWLALRGLRGGLGGADARRRTLLALVLAQTFVLPAIAVVGRSNVYTGIRQLLFAAPGLAILATVALAALVAGAGRWRSRRRWLAGAVLVVPAAAQLTLFPYEYAYSSAISNLVSPMVAKSHPSLEVQTDYWRTSVRELAPDIPDGGFVTCSPTLSRDVFWRHSNESADDCSTALVGPLAPYDDRRTLPWTPSSPTEFLAVRSGNGTVAQNCTKIADVTRRLYWRTIVMSTVSRCELPLEPYPSGGTLFDGEGTGGRYLMGGWYLHHTEQGAVLRAGGSGELGFEMPGPGALRVTLPSTGTGGVSLTVNGAPVALTTTATGLSGEVPASVVAAYGEDRVVIRLTAGEDDLHLLGVTLEGM